MARASECIILALCSSERSKFVRETENIAQVLIFKGYETQV